MERKILSWLFTGRVGMSSRAMAAAALGIQNDKSHPSDPSDFNRCLLLLKAVPEIRKRMNKVAALSPTWRKLVKRWAEVETCFIDEVGLDWCKGHEAPRTYRLMKEIGC